MYVHNEAILHEARSIDDAVTDLQSDIEKMRVEIDNYLTRANEHVQRSILTGQDLIRASSDDAVRDLMQQMRDDESNAAGYRRDALSVHETLTETKRHYARLVGDQSIHA